MRSSKLLFCFLAAFVLFPFFAGEGDCWQSETHKRLTDAAAWNEELLDDAWPYYGLEDFLSYWHGMNAETVMSGKSVRKWVLEGAVEEDKPVTRSFYHFHDPLKSWNNAGFSAMGLSWKSSVPWSQTPIGQQKYSWKNARQYFYRALSAPTDTERQQAYALMFKSLGHIMHLVQDAAVPDHTRNDAHLLFSVEKWVENNIERAFGYVPRSFNGKELMPLFGLPVGPFAPVQIARLFDSDQYTGLNPDITTSQPIGIAEYANANFLSMGTIFTYEHPALASTEPGETNGYLKKVAAGERIDHFLFAGPDWPARQERTFDLDDRCHEDYAKRLLPKAAQYAAMIPYYFFRASLDAVAPEGVPGDKINIYVGFINSSTEVMRNGIIEIYQKTSLTSWERIGQSAMQSLAPYDGTEATVMRIPVKCKNEDCDFYSPGYGCQWTIVFRGTLGNETDAVAGNRVWIML